MTQVLHLVLSCRYRVADESHVLTEAGLTAVPENLGVLRQGQELGIGSTSSVTLGNVVDLGSETLALPLIDDEVGAGLGSLQVVDG